MRIIATIIIGVIIGIRVAIIHNYGKIIIWDLTPT
jgi:hypothetical protein